MYRENMVKGWALLAPAVTLVLDLIACSTVGGQLGQVARVSENAGPTEAPTATPVLSATPVPALQQTPTPTPATAEANSQASPSDIGGGALLRISHRSPLAAREISFSTEGLVPWQPLEVTFIDPGELADSWITADDVRMVQSNGEPLTTITLFADSDGRAQWVRYGTQDEERAWSARISLGDRIKAVNYSIGQLPLSTPETFTLGKPLRGYRG